MMMYNEKHDNEKHDNEKHEFLSDWEQIIIPIIQLCETYLVRCAHEIARLKAWHSPIKRADQKPSFFSIGNFVNTFNSFCRPLSNQGVVERINALSNTGEAARETIKKLQNALRNEEFIQQEPNVLNIKNFFVREIMLPLRCQYNGICPDLYNSIQQQVIALPSVQMDFNEGCEIEMPKRIDVPLGYWY